MTNISQELVARISLSFAAAKATFPLMIVDVDVRMVVGKLFILLFGGIFFLFGNYQSGESIFCFVLLLLLLLHSAHLVFFCLFLVVVLVVAVVVVVVVLVY